MLKKIPAFFLASTLACAGTALGADTGFYVGGAIGQADTKFDDTLFNLRDNDGSFKLIAGFRPLSLFAVELNYVDFGRASDQGTHADTTGVDAFAVGFLPIPVVDLYGKVGLVNWKVDATSPSLSIDHSGWDPAYGVGAQVHWGSLGARLEYEKFQVSRASNLSLVSVGATWTFL